jgi:hypothetical protein
MPFDPAVFARFELEPSLAALCDLRLDLLDETERTVLDAGLWWIYPLGRNSAGQLIGLRLAPGTPLDASPVVHAAEAEAVTLCSRPGALVPATMFAQMVAGEPQWSRIAGLSDAAWAQAVALHRALGGEDDLEPLRSVAADRATAAALREPDDHPRWVRALAEARARLDPAPDSAAYWRYAAEVTVAKHAVAPVPKVGCWNNALAALVFWTGKDDAAPEPSRALVGDSAWRLLCAPPALDSSRAGAGLTLTPSSHKSTALGFAAAKWVMVKPQPEWGRDPRWPAVQGLAASRPYDGAAHLEAATALVRAGQPGPAFDALTAAAYWSYCVEGRARPDALEEAIALADRIGDATLTGALERRRDRQAELAEI